MNPLAFFFLGVISISPPHEVNQEAAPPVISYQVAPPTLSLAESDAARAEREDKQRKKTSLILNLLN